MSDFDFIDVNAEDVLKTLIQGVEEKIGEPLYPGDERRIFIEAIAVQVLQLLHVVNDNCKQRLIRYARNEVLDALGERMNVARLQPTPAKTVLRFSLAEARDRQTFIPAGTRATPDNKIQFATTGATNIESGALYADIPAECTTAGIDGNGFAIGTIQNLTDIVPYVSGVTNITVTTDGTAGEPADDGGEGDSRFRERIILAPAKQSTAGSGESYIYWAMTANAKISDVKVPNDHDAGKVDIIVLCEDGLPSEEVLNDVLKTCNDTKVRPMNDLVTASAPSVTKYDINFKYYVTAENEASAVSAIEGAGGSIDKFKAWQDTAIGRDINPDKLRALCLAPSSGVGALRIDVTAPKFTQLSDRQVAQWSGKITVSHEVVAE